MLILDESFPAGQASLLRSWRLHIRVVGIEVARLGIKDDNILPVLHRLSWSTFFSPDGDFYHPGLGHANYCLVWLNLMDDQMAEFTRRFLKHPLFDTQAKRMGTVVRAHPAGLSFWKLHQRQEDFASWSDT